MHLPPSWWHLQQFAANSHGCLAHLPASFIVARPADVWRPRTAILPAFVRDRLDQAGRKQTGGHLGGAAGWALLCQACLVGALLMTAPLPRTACTLGQTGDMLQGGLPLFALGIRHGHYSFIAGHCGYTLSARAPAPG